MNERESRPSETPFNSTRLTAGQIESLSTRLAQVKLVFFALIMGVVLFGIVVVAITGPMELVWPPSIISMILIGVAVITGMQGLVLPGIIRGSSVKNISGDTDARVSRLAGVWISSSLVGIALLESAAFLSLVGVFIEGNSIHVVVAAIFLGLMFLHFPGTNRILDWIDQTLGARQAN